MEGLDALGAYKVGRGDRALALDFANHEETYLVLLCVIAATLVLVLPGTALATYETPTQVTWPPGCNWNLDTGENGEFSEAHIVLSGGGGSEWQDGSFCVNTWRLGSARVAWHSFGESRTSAEITYADLVGITWPRQEAPFRSSSASAKTWDCRSSKPATRR